MAKITVKAIQSQIASFTTNRDKLRDQAHNIAMMIFHHAAPTEVSSECNGTGDCTMAPKLIEAMPRGWAELMKKWFHEFTPIRVSSDGKSVGFDKKYAKLSSEEKLAWWRIEDANVNRFDTLDPNGANGTKILSFDDLMKMVAQLAKRIDKKIEEDEVKPEDKLTLQAAAIKLAGLNFDKIPMAGNDEPAKEESVAA